MKTISLELPDSEARELADAVVLCGFADEKELAHEALRRFLDSHSANLQEKYVMQDVEWGLHGKE